jgi:capsular polysaccharide biosynthesis protein
MEFEELVRRVLGRHWRLIAACVALAVLAAVTLIPRESLYTSTARIVLDNEDPASRGEAAVIADTGRAIATSPANVRAALEAAGARRDVDAFAQDNVTVTALGSSSVLALSVKDRDPAVAAAVANRLAERVIRTRLQVTRGFVDGVREDLGRELREVDRRIGAAEAAIDRLSGQLARAGDDAAARLQLRRDAAVRRRDRLVQERSALESERAALLGAGARREPRVISPATVASSADESGMTADLALAVFLGLVVGIGTAGLIETLRPTHVGERSVARALGLPVLGTLSRPPGEADDPAELASLSLHLRLAAKAARVRSVRLVGLGADDLAPLAGRLDPPGRPAPARAVQVAVAGGGAPAATVDVRPGVAAGGADHVSIQPFDADSALRNGVASGLVVVAPDLVRAPELRAVRQLLDVSPSPALGAVVYPAARRPSRAKEWLRRARD